jgi:hypothetical protein
MRKELKKQLGQRGCYLGVVSKFGSKKNWHGFSEPTVMLVDVKDSKGKIVCEHLWFKVGKQIESLSLSIGDIVTFDARVTQYEKGYKGHRDDVYAPIEVDYRLSNPTKLKVVDSAGTFGESGIDSESYVKAVEAV